jgi:transcriptional regulator with XRE-family HTH domain
MKLFQMKVIWNGEQFSKQLKQKRLIDEDTDMRSLAIRINVSAATISRCENGKMPDLDAYAKLCCYLGQPLDMFIKIEAKKNKK